MLAPFLLRRPSRRLAVVAIQSGEHGDCRDRAADLVLAQNAIARDRRGVRELLARSRWAIVLRPRSPPCRSRPSFWWSSLGCGPTKAKRSSTSGPRIACFAHARPQTLAIHGPRAPVARRERAAARTKDADETVGGVKMFTDLAFGLASRGVAVLRYAPLARTRREGAAGARVHAVALRNALAVVREGLRQGPPKSRFEANPDAAGRARTVHTGVHTAGATSGIPGQPQAISKGLFSRASGKSPIFLRPCQRVRFSSAPQDYQVNLGSCDGSSAMCRCCAAELPGR